MKESFISKIKAKPAAKQSDNKNAIARKGGSYSLAVGCVVLAILVAVNIMFAIMPSTWTSFDISSTQLYSVSSNTKVVVNNLEKDVCIYWVVQADAEDDIIEKLLDKYDSMSSHIDVVKKNPDVYPTFTAEYTDESVPNNSLIVVSGDKSRYISYNNIYLTDVNYTTYSYDTSFDGEGAITSAISYVVSDDLPMVYVLTGHGEAELPATFSEQIEKDNVELTEFSLLNEDEIPEEADCVLIYAPETDISEEEEKILYEYTSGGGKLFVCAGPTEDGTLTNLCALLYEYGVSVCDGIVVEADRNYYAFQQPYILLPEIEDTEITSSLLEEKYYAIVPIAQGLDTSASSSTTVLLSTSDSAFSKLAGYDLDTYEKEDGDTDGPFALAVSVDCGNEGSIVWVASSDFLDEMYNSYSSGANVNFAMNALHDLVGESEAMSIRTKSLGYNYLTVSTSAASTLKTVMIIILPAFFIVLGVTVVITRRTKRNEEE